MQIGSFDLSNLKLFNDPIFVLIRQQLILVFGMPPVSRNAGLNSSWHTRTQNIKQRLIQSVPGRLQTRL
jgi:hypothetical protein